MASTNGGEMFIMSIIHICLNAIRELKINDFNTNLLKQPIIQIFIIPYVQGVNSSYLLNAHQRTDRAYEYRVVKKALKFRIL